MLTYIPLSFLFYFIFMVRVRVKIRSGLGLGLRFGFGIGNLIGGLALPAQWSTHFYDVIRIVPCACKTSVWKQATLYRRTVRHSDKRCVPNI